MSVGLWQDAMVEILGGSSQNESAFFFKCGIEERFFPQKAWKGAAVLTPRIPLGMKCFSIAKHLVGKP